MGDVFPELVGRARKSLGQTLQPAGFAFILRLDFRFGLFGLSCLALGKCDNAFLDLQHFGGF